MNSTPERTIRTALAVNYRWNAQLNYPTRRSHTSLPATVCWVRRAQERNKIARLNNTARVSSIGYSNRRVLGRRVVCLHGCCGHVDRHTMTIVRCSFSSIVSLRNDLYCVGRGVKLYSIKSFSWRVSLTQLARYLNFTNSRLGVWRYSMSSSSNR